MAARTAKTAPESAPQVIPGFKWTMAAVIEGPKDVLTLGAVVEVTTSKGKTEHVTVGTIVEEYPHVGQTWVKVWPAERVVVSANGSTNGNGSHDDNA